MVSSVSGSSSTYGYYGSSSAGGSTSTAANILSGGSYSSSPSSSLAGNVPTQVPGDQNLYNHLTGLQTLLNTVNQFQTLASALQTSATTPQFKVANTGIATVSNSETTTYSLDVTQLAQTQTVQSNTSLTDSGTTAVGTGSLTFQFGSYASGSNTFTSAGGAPTTINIDGSNNTLTGIAAAITNSGAGVTASVVQDTNGNYQLNVVGNATGSTNGFKITAADGSGTPITGNTGLGVLAFDPTATSGTGKNMTQSAAAQDASYSVNGLTYQSSTNNGVSITAGMNVNLMSTGQTLLTSATLPQNVASQAQTVATGINGLFSTINQLSGQGGPLENSNVAFTMRQDLSNAITQWYPGTYNTMDQIGITMNNGALQVDQNQLQSAYLNDPLGTTSLLQRIGAGLNSLSQTYASTGGSVQGEINTVAQSYQASVTASQESQASLAYSQAQYQAASQAYKLLGGT